MIRPDQVEALIKQELPESEVILEDLTGTQDHYQATIVSAAFDGLSLVKQHQLVYKSVNAVMASGELHALALKTYTPAQWPTNQ
jgi:acid stress-induced BolA-like protein IbaG/YrbA